MPDRFVKLSEIQVLFQSKSIDVTEDLVINWQTDKFGLTEKTYAEIFGNVIFKAMVAGDDGSGFITPFECNLSFNLNGNKTINQVRVQNILYPGKLTFI